jgi:hypothetical protein
MTNLALFPLPALVVTALAALAVSGCTASIDLGGDTTRRIDETTLPADGVEVIRVTTENGRVRVVGDDVTDISLRAVLVESDDGDADVEVATDGNRLTIAGECEDGWFEHCSVGFEIVAPEELDVSIETTNGRVEVDDVAGTIDIETDNGAIDADGLLATDVVAETDNGRIELDFDAAPDVVAATSDNGTIDVRVPDGDYDVEATSDNGTIDVDVPSDPDADRSITVDTDNGAIAVEPRS